MGVTDELTSGKVRTTTGEELRLDQKLGQGHEGVVFRVKGKPTAVKIYHEHQRTDRERKIRAMIARPPIDPTDHLTIAWPTSIVESPKSRTFLGYEMAFLDKSRYVEVLDYANQYLRWRNSDWRDRCKVALNLASAVTLVHKQGHALGDMNHQNILIKAGKVTLIDCDSFDVQGQGEYFTGSTEHSRYAPPEGRGSTRRQVQYADRFGLGIHLFQVLMEGFHPYQARGTDVHGGTLRERIKHDPFPYHQPIPNTLEPHRQAPEYMDLPASVRALFEDCFIDGQQNPAKRPTPETWFTTLRALYKPAQPAASTPATGNTPSNDPTPNDAKRRPPGRYPGHPPSKVSTEFQTLGRLALFIGAIVLAAYLLLEFLPIWAVIGLIVAATIALKGYASRVNPANTPRNDSHRP